MSEPGCLGWGQAGLCTEGGERKPWLEAVDRGRPAAPGENKRDTLGTGVNLFPVSSLIQ